MMRSHQSPDDSERTESILVLPESLLEPIDRGGTSSSNYTATEQNARQSLLIDNTHYQQELQETQTDMKRRVSTKQKNQLYFDCCQLFRNIGKSIKIRMAFKPSVPDDPRLFSPMKKRLILVCLASGSSLNGFCSTVYVIFYNRMSYSCLPPLLVSWYS